MWRDLSDKNICMHIPDAPCMDYLRTLGEKWPHSKGNVGKYSLHGAFGYCFGLVSYKH